MRGASALEEALEQLRDKRLRVLVVWEPVLATDIAPPTTGVLARVHDPRALQFWDPGRLTSERVLEARRAGRPPHSTAEPEAGEDVAWDAVALFPPGVLWEARLPEPDYYDGPIVDIVHAMVQRLAAAP